MEATVGFIRKTHASSNSVHRQETVIHPGGDGGNQQTTGTPNAGGQTDNGHNEAVHGQPSTICTRDAATNDDQQSVQELEKQTTPPTQHRRCRHPDCAKHGSRNRRKKQQNRQLPEAGRKSLARQNEMESSVGTLKSWSGKPVHDHTWTIRVWATQTYPSPSYTGQTSGRNTQCTMETDHIELPSRDKPATWRGA